MCNTAAGDAREVHQLLVPGRRGDLVPARVARGEAAGGAVPALQGVNGAGLPSPQHAMGLLPVLLARVW
eukprot:5772572-Pyramimonas_sp.AAC.1